MVVRLRWNYGTDKSFNPRGYGRKTVILLGLRLDLGLCGNKSFSRGASLVGVRPSGFVVGRRSFCGGYCRKDRNPTGIAIWSNKACAAIEVSLGEVLQLSCGCAGALGFGWPNKACAPTEVSLGEFLWLTCRLRWNFGDRLRRSFRGGFGVGVAIGSGAALPIRTAGQ